MDPLGSAINDSGTPLGLGRGRAQGNRSFPALWTCSYRHETVTQEAHRAKAVFFPLFLSPHLSSFLLNEQWKKWHL